MKKILGYLKDYAADADRRIVALTMLFTAAAVYINYGQGLNDRILDLDYHLQFVAWYLVFLAAFIFPYLLLVVFRKKNPFRYGAFVALLLIAPAIFAWKMYYDPAFSFSDDKVTNAYWNRVVYFPFKLLVVVAMLFPLWMIFNRGESFYGLTAKGFEPKPYLLMLLIMVPLIAAASTQPDFLAMYPKLKSISSFTEQHTSGWYKFIYELSYGIDFVGIELFFRGFLVLAFVKWAGKDALLPMACFYCTIHFGKPVGECISSFFGGLLLGILTLHTRTILGGLMVHLGIAWLMEIGGYLGRSVGEW
ncbi:MAG TPA: CPBP family glutamic-type intramembrane protease [Flavisolibacter sp.]|jgi:hypothetical protein